VNLTVRFLDHPIGRCGYDKKVVWTATSCTTNATSSGHHAVTKGRSVDLNDVFFDEASADDEAEGCAADSARNVARCCADSATKIEAASAE
jgi:hypothetical protein